MDMPSFQQFSTGKLGPVRLHGERFQILECPVGRNGRRSESSGVRCLWVGRDDTRRLQDRFGDVGILVVPWCDQLRVLSHSSVGGFLTHCGWSSVFKATFSGVPMLGFQIFVDQFTNCKQIAEDWRNGWRLKKGAGGGEDVVIRREKIAETVQRFMDVDSGERRELIEKAKQVQNIFESAIAEGGSLDTNLDAFIKDITKA